MSQEVKYEHGANFQAAMEQTTNMKNCKMIVVFPGIDKEGDNDTNTNLAKYGPLVVELATAFPSDVVVALNYKLGYHSDNVLADVGASINNSVEEFVKWFGSLPPCKVVISHSYGLNVIAASPFKSSPIIAMEPFFIPKNEQDPEEIRLFRYEHWNAQPEPTKNNITYMLFDKDGIQMDAVTDFDQVQKILGTKRPGHGLGLTHGAMPFSRCGTTDKLEDFQKREYGYYKVAVISLVKQVGTI